MRGWEEGRCWDTRLLEGSLLIVHWGHPHTKAGVEMYATGPTGTAHAQDRPEAGQAISLEGTPLPLCVLRSLSPSAPKPDSQQEGKNAPKRIIQWLLGKKIVNVLVPFTKPQPKKVTYKIPERKQHCSLWLRLSSCGRELWPSVHSRDGGSGDRMGPDHPFQSRL